MHHRNKLTNANRRSQEGSSIRVRWGMWKSKASLCKYRALWNKYSRGLHNQQRGCNYTGQGFVASTLSGLTCVVLCAKCCKHPLYSYPSAITWVIPHVLSPLCMRMQMVTRVWWMVAPSRQKLLRSWLFNEHVHCSFLEPNSRWISGLEKKKEEEGCAAWFYHGSQNWKEKGSSFS